MTVALIRRGRQARLTAGAFLRIGYLDAMAFPLATLLVIAQPLTNVVLYYFVARLVAPNPTLIGTDYFTYALVGVLVLRVLGAGLDEFGLFVQRTIDQGQLALYLSQPVNPVLLPFAWLEWPLVLRLVGGVATVGVGVALGADLRADQLLLSLIVILLGVTASHAIGVIATSVRVLARRADPVLLLYTVATSVFSGLFVPVQLLPGPLQALAWLTPHSYVVDALRQLVTSGDLSSRVSVPEAIAGLLVFNVVAYAVGLSLFSRSIAFARRHGLVEAQ